MANTVTGFNNRTPAGLVEIVGTFAPVIAFRATVSGTTTSEGLVFPGLALIRGAVVQVLDSGNNVATTDADITWSGNTLTIADGSTFNLDAAGHVIYGFVWGDPRA